MTIDDIVRTHVPRGHCVPGSKKEFAAGTGRTFIGSEEPFVEVTVDGQIS